MKKFLGLKAKDMMSTLVNCGFYAGPAMRSDYTKFTMQEMIAVAAACGPSGLRRRGS
jgi:hypothetical protein